MGFEIEQDAPANGMTLGAKESAEGLLFPGEEVVSGESHWCQKLVSDKNREGEGKKEMELRYVSNILYEKSKVC